MTLGFYVSYAWRSLLRDGQRSVLAIVCVAFGVFSLVALQQLAHIIDDAILVSPRVAEGGDMVLRKTAVGITRDDLRSLDDLGIDRYCAVADTDARWVKTSTSGRATVVARALGIDPQRHPLYGDIELRAPAGASARQALIRDGNAIVTRDVADALGLGVGDRFFVFGSPRTPPFELSVGGVARQTPERQGSGVYFSLSTARELGMGRMTRVMVRHDRPDQIVPHLEAAGWSVRLVPEEARTEEAKLFHFMLAGAGILGLLIGGIGVANTMQVLLARRTKEIATLKTIGYEQRHLLLIFGFEAVMLGSLGSAMGVIVGLALAKVLMSLISVSMPFLLEFQIRPSVAVSGLLVGVSTTVIFGMAAIVKASGVRPSVLLRQVTAKVGVRRRAATWLLYGVLTGLFGLLSSVVLRSLVQGFGVVAAGIVGLAILGGVLGAVLYLVVRVPMPGLPLLAMARRNLRHRPVRSIYGLVALFVGVVAIGFATVSILDASQRLTARQIDLSGVNLRVYTSSADEPSLLDALAGVGVETSYTDFFAEARAYSVADSLLPGLRDIVGRRNADLRWNLSLTDSLEVPSQEAAYIHERLSRQWAIAAGDTLTLRNEHGEATVRVAGIYGSQASFLSISAPPDAIVVPLAIAQRLSQSVMPAQVSVAADPERLAEVAGAIGEALPRTVVIGKDTLANVINGYFVALFWFAVSVAGLALVAGAVLIANAVGLSMLERRRELGVLKAVGYASHQVLWTVVLENASLGLIGGGTGVLGVWITVLAVNLRFPQAELSLGLGHGLLLVTVATVFAVVSAVLVAWRPTHARPASVLRET